MPREVNLTLRSGCTSHPFTRLIKLLDEVSKGEEIIVKIRSVQVNYNILFEEAFKKGVKVEVDEKGDIALIKLSK